MSDVNQTQPPAVESPQQATKVDPVKSEFSDDGTGANRVTGMIQLGLGEVDDETEVNQDTSDQADPAASSTTALEDTEGAFEPAESDLWGKLSKIDKTETNSVTVAGLESLIDEWKTKVEHARIVIVSGHTPDLTRLAAERLAVAWKSWLDARSSSRMTLQRFGYKDAIENFLLPPYPRCLVLEHWGVEPGRDLVRHIHHLREAAKEFHDKDFGLIIWTQDAVIADLITRGQFPDNVRPLRLPEHSPAHKECSSDVSYEKLFGFEAKTLQEVLDGGANIIEVNLVRLLVLFGDLPESDVEELMLKLLADKTITVPSTEVNQRPSKVKAVGLWEMNRARFIRRAGLVTVTDQSPQKISFPSPESRKKAELVAWQDTPAMSAIFAAVRDVSILFSDESENVRQDLFEGYVNAAAILARKDPRLYGNHWLDSISAEYSMWVSTQAPDIQIKDNTDLLSFLTALKSAGKRQMLWDRFIQRMAYLFRSLLTEKEPAKIVNSFLESLAARDMYPLLWRLVAELRASSLDFPKWSRRIIHDSPQLRFKVLTKLAKQVLLSTSNARRLMQMFASWMPSGSQSPKNAIEEASLQFPAIVLEEWYGQRNKERKKSGSIKRRFLTLEILISLDLEESALPTVYSYWLTCFKSEYFDEAVRKWKENGPGVTGYALAACLYQAVEISAPVSRDAIYKFAREICDHDPKQWNASRHYWRLMSASSKQQKRKLSYHPDNDDQRMLLDERADICDELNQI